MGMFWFVGFCFLSKDWWKKTQILTYSLTQDIVKSAEVPKSTEVDSLDQI